MLKKTLPWLIVVLLVSLAGCSLLRSAGRNLAEGIAERADTVGTKLVEGARRTLAEEETQARLRATVGTVGAEANLHLNAARDSLLGAYTRAFLAGVREDLLGGETRNRVGLLRNELLGPEAQARVALLRDAFIGEAARARLLLLRDEFLGPETEAGVRTLGAGLIAGVAEGYAQNLRALVREEIDYARQQAEATAGRAAKEGRGLLWTLGGVIALLLLLGGFIVWRLMAQRKILRVLTTQIHHMPDQQAYDELTHRIQTRAQETGVEAPLRRFLERQGLQTAKSY